MRLIKLARYFTTVTVGRYAWPYRGGATFPPDRKIYPFRNAWLRHRCKGGEASSVELFPRGDAIFRTFQRDFEARPDSFRSTATEGGDG